MKTHVMEETSPEIKQTDTEFGPGAKPVPLLRGKHLPRCTTMPDGQPMHRRNPFLQIS